MSVFSHDPRGSLEPVRDGLTYSADRTAAHELTAQYATIFLTLREEHDGVRATEVKLHDMRSEKRARLDASAEGVAELSDRLSKQVLLLTGNNRQHAQYKVFFGSMTPGEFAKQLLARKFELVSGWEVALDKTEHPSLKPFGPELKPRIAAALDARKALEAIDNEIKLFREVGERRQFFDKVNAARQQVYGEVSKLPFVHVGLPRNFADRFFTHKRPRISAVEEPTKASVTGEIEALKAELEAKEKLLQELEAEEAKAAQKEAELKAEEEAIAALEKQAADASAQAAMKRAKLSTIQHA